MSIELKIKALSLGYEAKQIRRFERKLKAMRNYRVKLDNGKPLDAGVTLDRAAQVFDGANEEGYRAWGNAKLVSLHNHRTDVVRKAARSTHLARMFLKGTPYKAAEAKARTEPNWEAIIKMAIQYGRYAKPGENEPLPRGVFSGPSDLRGAFAEWRLEAIAAGKQ